MIINLNDLSVMLGVISILIGGAIWVMSLINKTSVRATNIERDVDDLEKRVVKIEEKTEYVYQEKLITDVFVKATNSKEFKDSLRQTIKDTILHLDRNRSITELQFFEEILNEIKSLKNEKK